MPQKQVALLIVEIGRTRSSTSTQDRSSAARKCLKRLRDALDEKSILYRKTGTMPVLGESEPLMANLIGGTKYDF